MADRFHLLQHRADALDQVFRTHGSALKAVREIRSRTPVVPPDGRPAAPVPPRTPPPQERPRAAQRRSRRLATYGHVWTLHRQGWSNRAMARPLGIGRMTVVRSLQAPIFPERQGHSKAGKRVLTPEKARLLKRWNAGRRQALQRFRDLRRHGDTGSSPTAARYAHRRRQAQGLQPRAQHPGRILPLVMEGQHKPLTTRRATRLVLKRPQQRPGGDTQLIAPLQARHREVAAAIELAQDFCGIVRERQADRFERWLGLAVASGVAPLQRLATGLRADYAAVKAGIALKWRTGPAEGHINRLKRLKRSMLGRAKVDLLSRRFLLVA